MSKKVLVITSSLRANSNSDTLAAEFAAGAQAAGHDVEIVSLKDKQLAFCRGCMACQKLHRCVINDDAVAIAQKMLGAQVIAFATPVYYYDMSGQLKTLLDRANSLFAADYAFREIYLLATAADAEEGAVVGTATSIKGWVSCFEKAELKGIVFGGGVTEAGDIKEQAVLKEAYNMGQSC